MPGRDRRVWWIGLAGWSLQGGYHDDVVTGRRHRFALEFGYLRSRRLRTTDDTVRRCRPAAHPTHYEVTGLLERAGSEPGRDAFVLDVGLRAYKTQMVLDDLRPPAVGSWLTGTIVLAVDPFDYVELLAGRDGMPPLIHTWTVEEVQLDLTPRIVVEHGHPLHDGPDERPRRVRDTTREAWRTVPRTRAWEVEGDYRLRCRLEDDAPTSSVDEAPGGA